MSIKMNRDTQISTSLKKSINYNNPKLLPSLQANYPNISSLYAPNISIYKLNYHNDY